MAEPTIELFLMLLPWALTGSGVRLSLGIYKAYDSILGLQLSWKRMLFEVLFSTLFGIFGGVFLTQIEAIKFGVGLGTMACSIIGASSVELVAKKIGWSRKMEVKVSDEQMGMDGLNSAEINAYAYAKLNGSITNRTYQKINRTNADNAKYELSVLVDKGKLRMIGRTKDTRYIIA
jgi:hypothetical protein